MKDNFSCVEEYMILEMLSKPSNISDLIIQHMCGGNRARFMSCIQHEKNFKMYKFIRKFNVSEDIVAKVSVNGNVSKSLRALFDYCSDELKERQGIKSDTNSELDKIYSQYKFLKQSGINENAILNMSKLELARINYEIKTTGKWKDK